MPDEPPESVRNIVNIEDPTMPTAEGLTAIAASKLKFGSKSDGSRKDNSEKAVQSDKAPRSSVKESDEHSDEAVASSTVTAAALSATIDAAKELGKMASEAVGKVIDQVESVVGEGSVGPYESPSTCAQSDLDPLAGCVKAGVDMKGEQRSGQGRDAQE